MSLRAFHILFVTLSIVLAIWFGLWASHPLVSAAAFALALLLTAYLSWFVRKIRSRDDERRRRLARLRQVKCILTLVVVGLVASRPLLACEVCYGEAEGPLIEAARSGVWLLFGLTAAMQVAFAAFFIRLWRHARRHRRADAVHASRQKEGAS